MKIQFSDLKILKIKKSKIGEWFHHHSYQNQWIVFSTCKKKLREGKKNHINIRKKATLLDGTYTIFIIKKETKMYVNSTDAAFFHCIVEVRG